MPVKELATVDLKDRAIKGLEFARTCTRSLLEGVPEDKCAFQPCPTANHVLWILGHIAVTDEWITGMISDRKAQLPGSYSKLFGYQTQVHPSAKHYPPLAEVKKQFEATRESLIKAITGAPQDKLLESLTDKTGGFAFDGFDAINKEAWHEGWHAGQLATIRRSLGLKPAI